MHLKHLSRDHPESEQSGQVVSFKCLVCILCNFHTEKQYFEHLGSHLKKHETIQCVFKGCSYSTYIYTTFASHKSRKHTPHCLEDFKETILQSFSIQATEDDSSLVDETDVSSNATHEGEGEDLVKVIVDELASLLLKLDCIFNVPSRCIDEIIGELQFITSSASAPVLKSIIEKTLEDHNCTVGEVVITDLVNNICQLNPLSAAFERGPLGTAYQRNKYLNEHFSIVEPVEYILDKEGKSFQYIPILQSLSNLLKDSAIQNSAILVTIEVFLTFLISRKIVSYLERNLDFHCYSTVTTLKYAIH